MGSRLRDLRYTLDFDEEIGAWKWRLEGAPRRIVFLWPVLLIDPVHCRPVFSSRQNNRAFHNCCKVGTAGLQNCTEITHDLPHLSLEVVLDHLEVERVRRDS